MNPMKSVPVESKSIGWEEEFEKLWKYHLDWVGSGFRYNDASLTATGLEETKPKFKALISQTIQAAKEEERKTATTEINSIYDYLLGTDSLPWEEDVEEMRKKSLSIINKHQ